MNFDLGNNAQTSQNTDGMVFNLNDVQEASSSFEVLPKGTYEAVIEELEYTLSQSSNAPMIKAVYIAEEAAETYEIPFLYRDFRPLFKAGQEKARELGFYMQKYCGCVFSEEERYLKKNKIIP